MGILFVTSTTIYYIIINQISHLDRGGLQLIKLSVCIRVMQSMN
jgi:hypothetical protein